MGHPRTNTIIMGANINATSAEQSGANDDSVRDGFADECFEAIRSMKGKS